jgi:flagellar biosynthesis anti-sigma factor FlgM
MRIDFSNTTGKVPESQQARGNSPSAREKVGGGNTSSDKVDLAVDRLKVQAAQSDARETELRHQRVQALQKAVADGNYRVSDEQIASAMLAHQGTPGF